MIRHTPCRVWICRVLLILNLFFIWGNSLLPGSVSLGLSDWVLDILKAIMGTSGGGTGSGLLRKLAHGGEFACLSMLLSFYVRMLCKNKSLHIFLPLIFSFAVACADETIQLFIPARGPGILDVGIDTCGAIMGIIVFCGVYYLIKRSIIHSEE